MRNDGSRIGVRGIAIRIAALGVLVVTAVVPAVTKVGPVLLTVGPGLGLHALDVVLIVGGVPIVVMLLRYADRHREDREEEMTAGSVSEWRR